MSSNIEANPAVFVPGETGGQPNSTEDNVNYRRLYSGCTLADPTGPCNYASAGEISGQANSIYNALEVSLKKAGFQVATVKVTGWQELGGCHTVVEDADDAVSLTGTQNAPVGARHVGEGTPHKQRLE